MQVFTDTLVFTLNLNNTQRLKNFARFSYEIER